MDLGDSHGGEVVTAVVSAESDGHKVNYGIGGPREGGDEYIGLYQPYDAGKGETSCEAAKSRNAQPGFIGTSHWRRMRGIRNRPRMRTREII